MNGISTPEEKRKGRARDKTKKKERCSRKQRKWAATMRKEGQRNGTGILTNGSTGLQKVDVTVNTAAVFRFLSIHFLLCCFFFFFSLLLFFFFLSLFFLSLLRSCHFCAVKTFWSSITENRKSSGITEGVKATRHRQGKSYASQGKSYASQTG